MSSARRNVRTQAVTHRMNVSIDILRTMNVSVEHLFVELGPAGPSVRATEEYEGFPPNAARACAELVRILLPSLPLFDTMVYDEEEIYFKLIHGTRNVAMVEIKVKKPLPIPSQLSPASRIDAREVRAYFARRAVAARAPARAPAPAPAAAVARANAAAAAAGGAGGLAAATAALAALRAAPATTSPTPAELGDFFAPFIAEAREERLAAEAREDARDARLAADLEAANTRVADALAALRASQAAEPDCDDPCAPE